MNNQSESLFESLSVPKALSKFILPAVISQLATLILNLTDAFFVGQTGDAFQISAMTITMPLILIMTVIATVFGAGGNANVAASLGAKKPEGARYFSAFAVYTAISVIAVISILIFIFESHFLSILGANEGSMDFCRGYIKWTLHIACVPMVFSQVMAQLFSSQGDTKLASIGITGAGIINVILDPIFIFIFKQGIVGAGIATCIANYCSALFFLYCYFRKRQSNVISLQIKNYTWKNGIATNALAIGIPAGLGIFLMLIVDFVRNYLIGVHGTQEDMAAWGVVQKLGNAFLQIAIGIAMGIRPLIAYNYTARLGKRTKSLIRGSAIIMGAYTLTCLVVLLFPEALVSVFLPIPDVMPIAVSFVRLFIFQILGVGFIELFNSLFQAMGQWKIAIISVFIEKIIVMIPALFMFVRLWKNTGIIAAQPVVDTLTALTLFVILFSFIKKNRERFS